MRLSFSVFKVEIVWSLSCSWTSSYVACQQNNVIQNTRQPTFSFFSVSCFNSAERVSAESPFCTDPVGLEIDLRTPGELREEGVRGLAAERAVAPLEMEDDGE